MATTTSAAGLRRLVVAMATDNMSSVAGAGRAVHRSGDTMTAQAAVVVGAADTIAAEPDDYD